MIKSYIIDLNSVFVIGAILGSQLPDIDIKYSKLGRIIPVWLFLKHRGPTHSIFALVLLTAIISYFNLSFGLGLCFGYGLHLLADLTTPMRLPAWNFPFNKGARQWVKR